MQVGLSLLANRVVYAIDIIVLQTRPYNRLQTDSIGSCCITTSVEYHSVARVTLVSRVACTLVSQGETSQV